MVRHGRDEMASQSQNQIASALIRKGVPMVYESVKGVWLKSKVSKPNQFYYVNGKLVSKNLAAAAVRCGLAEV
jgi:hypothetical protein